MPFPETGPGAKRAAFVREYLVDRNATQAAIRAGYAAKSAKQEGHRLIQRADVKAALEIELAILARRTRVSAERVLEELGEIAFSNMLDYVRVDADGSATVDLSRMSREQAAALTEVVTETYVEGKGPTAKNVVRVKVKLADKRAALVDLGRHLKLFTDKVETEHSGGVTVVLNGDEAGL